MVGNWLQKRYAILYIVGAKIIWFWFHLLISWQCSYVTKWHKNFLQRKYGCEPLNFVVCLQCPIDVFFLFLEGEKNWRKQKSRKKCRLDLFEWRILEFGRKLLISDFYFTKLASIQICKYLFVLYIEISILLSCWSSAKGL